MINNYWKTARDALTMFLVTVSTYVVSLPIANKSRAPMEMMMHHVSMDRSSLTKQLISSGRHVHPCMDPQLALRCEQEQQHKSGARRRIGARLRSYDSGREAEPTWIESGPSGVEVELASRRGSGAAVRAAGRRHAYTTDIWQALVI